jgi:hypothetical protein
MCILSLINKGNNKENNIGEEGKEYKKQEGERNTQGER